VKTSIRTVIILLGCAFLGATNVFAQWTKIANSVVTPLSSGQGNNIRGAIHFRDGILWVGWLDDFSGHSLSFSNDSGKTWQQTSLSINGGTITDINFLDRNNGIVSTLDDGVFLTKDGGVTWKKILSVQECTNLAFDRSPNIIHVLTGGNFPSPTGLLHTSLNGGATWTASWPGGQYSQAFTEALDGTIYSLNSSDAANGLPGFVSFSTDKGMTWQQNVKEVDGDSYTICADSCDVNTLYIANEDYTASVDYFSELYYSNNKGNSWTSALAVSTQPFPKSPHYFTGAMTVTENAIYASTLDSGIFRSINKGKSWEFIGGGTDSIPGAFDSRNIACANDNLVFILDANGNIWETNNSGNDSLTASMNDLLLSRNSFFANDTVIVCDSSVTQFLTFQAIGCISPTILNVVIQGKDQSSYQLIPPAGDSLGVTFLPKSDSINAAQLLITLSNGSQKIVPLSGFGRPRIPLTISSQSQITADTLGGSITVPITINGLNKPENVTVVLHYDTILNYTGSYSAFGGGKLDIAGEQWKGRSKLNISNAVSGKILGYAHFDVFADSVPTQLVAFDSLLEVTSEGCQFLFYVFPDEVQTTITPLSGCGVVTISRFLHYGQMPQFALMPNPTSGNALITSTIDLGDAQVIIYDMLGNEHGRSRITLTKDTPANIDLAVPSGVYVLRLVTSAGIHNLEVVVNR
jgi:photosystem II stability/assembly factor-like uncharacterized protein